MGQKQSKPRPPGSSDKPKKRWSFRHRSSRQRASETEASSPTVTASVGTPGGSDAVASHGRHEQTEKQRKRQSDETSCSVEVYTEKPLTEVDAQPDNDPDAVDVNSMDVAPIGPGQEHAMACQTSQQGTNNRTYNIGPQSTVHIYEGSSPVEATDDLNPEFPFPLEQYQNAIRLHYKAAMGQLQPLAWNEDFTMKTDDIFTDVDLLLQSPKGGNISRKTLPSVADALVARPDCSCPGRVLIEGQPGVGKTTTLSKLVLDWTKGDNKALSEFDLVFYLALRKVAESQSLVDCIFDQLLPEDSPFDEAGLEEYLQTNNKVLIVLDGYDEWEPQETHDIGKVLSGKILRDCCVLVSTRPSRTSELLKTMRPDTRLEINGFHQENVSIYVHKYFSNNISKAKTLLEKLDSSYLSTGITLTPMFLLLICILWEERDDVLLSDRLCPLYDQLVLYLITRLCAKEDIHFVGDNMPPNIAAAMLFLEKLAFDGLMGGKLVFEEEEITHYSNDVLGTLLELGFLHKQRSPSKLRPSPQYSFPHKTMQEYFAGRYIASYETGQDESAGRSLLEVNFGTVRKVREMDNVLIFACGRLGRKASVIFQYLADLHQKDLEPFEHDFHTFYDLGLKKDWVSDTEFDDLVSMEDYVTFQMTGIFTDTPAVLLVYQTYLETTLLCHYESGQIDGFVEHFLQRRMIQFSNPTPPVCRALAEVMKCDQLCQAQKGSQQECDMVLRLMHTRQFCLGPILDTLRTCPCIVELNLRQSFLGRYGQAVTRPSLQLSRQLPHLKQLRKLVLSWNDLLPEDAQLILPVLESLRMLEELYLSGNDLHGTSDIFSNILPFLIELKILKVFDCCMTSAEIISIAHAMVKNCEKMSIFDFDSNITTRQEYRRIDQILKLPVANELTTEQSFRVHPAAEIFGTKEGRRMFAKYWSSKAN